jgi:hypothetical protein
MDDPKLTSDAAPTEGRQSLPPNPFWRLTILAGGLFTLSCLAWIAASFGDPRAPVNRFLNESGGLIVGVTGLVVGGAAFAAMAVDRRQTRASVRSW